MKYILTVLFILAATLSCIAQHKKPLEHNAKYSISLQVPDLFADSAYQVFMVQLRERPDSFFTAWRNQILQIDPEYHVAWLKMTAVQADSIAGNPEVVFIQKTDRRVHFEMQVPGYDPSSSALLYASQNFPEVNGKDQNIILKEERPDLEDPDYKGRVLLTGKESLKENQHATEVASMLLGAGYTGWQARGAAPLATLLPLNVDGFMPEAPEFYFDKNISNHSYGVGIENEYGIEATAYDHAAFTSQNVQFVFSAGNSGTTTSQTGPYKGITHWANLTGNFKMSKNSIAVAALDSFGQYSPQSSSGPAYDGRLKPEISAFGATGTSGAAALVSGAAARIYHALEQMNEPAKAALTKAILIAGADDKGREGPDFKMGYGELNVYESLKIINSKNFATGEIRENEKREYPIHISKKIALRVALSWTDPAATAGSEKALVNDLDLMLISAGGDTMRPWVLNHFAHADSLSLEATRKPDTLNNLEVISHTALDEGIYTIVISNRKLQSQNQAFALAWVTRDTGYFYFTNPLSSEPFNDDGATIRWSTNRDGGAALYFHDLTAGSVSHIADVSLQKNGMAWMPQFGKTTRGILEMRSTGFSVFSDSFYIHAPLRLRTGFNCDDAFELVWNKIDKADRYTVYGLGDNKLDSLFSTAETSMGILRTATYQYYTVVPKFGTVSGMPAPVIHSVDYGTGCFINSLFAIAEMREGKLEIYLSSLSGVKKVEFLKLIHNDTVRIHEVTDPVEFTLRARDSQLYAGINRYLARVTLANGTPYYSSIAHLYYGGVQKIYFFSNPVKRGQELIAINETGTALDLVLYDISGRPVLKSPLPYAVNSIPVPAVLQAGIYYGVAIGENSKDVYRLKLLVLE